MPNYSITHGVNTLNVSLSGKFEPERGNEFLKAFQAEVAKIQPSNTVLHFSAGDFHVLSADYQDGLKACFAMYQKIGFKKIMMDLGNNAILSMQVKRLASEAGLKNFEIV
jgi:two-component sensor histidine kinase